MAEGAARTAIVTGAARGIGAAITARLVADGWRVAAVDIDAAGLASLERGGPEARPAAVFTCDVGDEGAVADTVDAIHHSLGRLDALVNNVGIVGSRTPLWELSSAEWDRILRVDLSSVFFWSRAVVPLMLTRGWGRVVNMASIAGKEGFPYAAAYSTAKAGLIALTKSLAKELATSGILVNCVTPADVDTPIHGNPPPEEVARWVAGIPIGRLGRAEEVANLVAWLVSDECSFSTGAVFDLSGGRSTY